MKLGDIAAYDFNADIYCPSCILDALPTGEGQPYDGWADLSGQPVEASLDELAAAFQIDRADETSFDSGVFPKAILGQTLDSSGGSTDCGRCGDDLMGH